MSYKGGKKLQCAFCDKDVAKELFATCADCRSQLMLCLECLAAGVEQGSHSKTHAYRIVDGQNSGSLLASGWTADDELALLDAIEAVGFGRWTDVAHRVPGRTAADCQAHYIDTYLKCPTAPLPELLALRLEREAEGGGAAAAATAAPTKPPLATMASAMLLPTAPAAAGAVIDTKLGPEYAGFYTKRGDYEVEYLDRAELCIDNVVIYPDDSEQDKALKTALLEVYNRQVLKRVQRRCLATAFGINNPPVQQFLNSTEELKSLYEVLRPFGRFQTPAQHGQLLMSLHRRSELLRRVAHLQELRRNGITTFAEAEHYKQAVAARSGKGKSASASAAAAAAAAAASTTIRIKAPTRAASAAPAAKK